MSTQTLPPLPGTGMDVYNSLHLLPPDGQLQSIPLQSLNSLLELEGLFAIQANVKDEFNDELRQAFDKELAFLGLFLKANDLDSYKHSMRVKGLTQRFLRTLDLAPDDAMTIEAGALLHDLGKIAIDDAILRKSTPLNSEEFAVIKKHPAFGAMILSQFKTMRLVMPLVYYHHERWDGEGYPAGLRGEAIPLGARILAITDAFDAITSQRPYQPARTPAQAVTEIRACAGTQFDPLLAGQFCDSLELWLPISQAGVPLAQENR